MKQKNKEISIQDKGISDRAKCFAKRKARILVHKVTMPVEINYEKLATAIVKAQLELNREPADKESKKVVFWKSIWLILRGRKDTRERLTTGVMSLPLSILFHLLSIMGLILFCVGIYVCYKQALTMSWVGLLFLRNSVYMTFVAAILFIILLYSIVLWGAAKELVTTNDKHFVVAVFSGIVSLSALVVALIALKTQTM